MMAKQFLLIPLAVLLVAGPATGADKDKPPAPDLSEFPKLTGKLELLLGHEGGYIGPKPGEPFRLELADLARVNKVGKLQFDPGRKSYIPLPGPLAVEAVHYYTNGAFKSMRLVSRGKPRDRVVIDIVPKEGEGPNRVKVWVIIEDEVISGVARMECQASGPFPAEKGPRKPDRLADWPTDAPLQLRPRVGRSAIGPRDAERRARQYLGIDKAKELRLAPAYLTDTDFPFLRPEKRPVWLAEVRDLRLPGGKGKPVLLSHLYVAIDAGTGQLVEAFTAPARPWWRGEKVVGPAHEKFFRESRQLLEPPTGPPGVSLTEALRGMPGDGGQEQIVVRYALYSNRGEGSLREGRFVPVAERRPALLVFREGLHIPTRAGEVRGRSLVVVDAATGARLYNESYGNPKE